MNSKKFGYINDVDQLIESTSVDQVLNHFGMPLSEKQSGEHRMNCVFNDECTDSHYGNLTVKLNDAINRIYCHTCKVRGNLLTLIHGLEHRRPPAGGRLRGEEFKSAVSTLKKISGDASQQAEQALEKTTSSNTSSPATTPDSSAPKPVNVPLRRHENERARELANLHEELVVDVEQMSPEAAQYVRKRPWMTPELMRKWGVGWIPGNGRSLFRKSYLVYTHRNERGEVISYSGRDLNFEKKWQKWIRDGKPEGKKPSKHRFVSGFHRGLELYGGYASRVQEPQIQESLSNHGLVIVEGPNDANRLDELGIAAVALCSNRATDHQVETITRFAKQAASGRVVLLPDCDEEGEAGFKDLLWRLAEQDLAIDLRISSRMYSGTFLGLQPEMITAEESKVLFR